MEKHDKQEETAADIALNRLAAIVESSDDAIIGKDLNGVVTSWNQGAEKIFGYPAAEMIGTSILRIFPPERREEEKHILDKIGRGEAVEHFETVRLTRQGERLDLSVSISPIKNSEGLIVGASKIARDITQRKFHEQEVLRMSRLYATLSQINQAIVWTREQDELFEKICRVLVELGKFNLAWIGKAHSKTGRLHPVAQWGEASNYLNQMEISVEKLSEQLGPVRTTILDGTSYICNDFSQDPNTGSMHGLADRAGFRSMSAFPIHLDGEVWGAMMVYADEVGYFQDKEIALLNEAAGDISFALDFLQQDKQRQQAEEALRESDERFRALFDRSLDGVFLNDFDGNILEANQAALDMIGYTREDLSTLTFNSLLSVDQLPLAHRVTEEIQTTGRQQRPTEFRLRTRDGGEIYVETRSSLITREGKPTAILGVARDLTEKKHAAAELEASERKFRELVHNMPVALVKHSPDSAILYANPMASKLLGLDHEELLGRTVDDPVWDFVREDGSPLPEKDYPVNRTLRAGDGMVSDELLGIQKPDGTHITWVQCSGHTIRDQAGDIHQVVITFTDLTEQRKAKIAQARLATAVEQSAEAIFITDIDGHIVYTNPSFEKITGYTADEVMGKNPRMLRSGKHDPSFYHRLFKALKAGESWQGQITIACKHDKNYDVETIISPVRDASGRVVNYAAGLRDISREKQLEAKFHQAQKMEAFGQLAGGVAHDFNNILMVIQLHAGMLLSETNPSPEQLEFAGDIQKAAERAADLTRQLLLFSRKQSMQAREVELRTVLENMTKMLRRTLEEQIQLEFAFADAPLHVHADPGMMDQILLNLVVNARYAMPKGGRILIETSVAEFDEVAATQTVKARPGRFACLSVSDTGKGISPEVLPRIFEPFYTTKEVGKGTGLGLATVYGIVEQHSGWINAYSELGHGTTFRVYLPLLSTPSIEGTDTPSPESIEGGTETILLVEDEFAVRSAMRITLSQLGYRVLEAATGGDAIDVWEDHRDEIQVMLTDLVMPGGMTGIELAKQLQEKDPELRVVYASGYSADIVGEEFFLEEGVDFLAKPFRTQELAKTIRNRLDLPPASSPRHRPR